MAQSSCSCRFKEQMISEMLDMRKQLPDKENDWIDCLFPEADDAADQSLCCLLTCLFYYGYCKECSVSVSEKARMVLSPLMMKTELN